MWVPKLLISPVIIRIFCPKTTKFGPNLAFLSIAGSFGALFVGWLVVVARAVSRKTPIYFIDNDNNNAIMMIPVIVIMAASDTVFLLHLVIITNCLFMDNCNTANTNTIKMLMIDDYENC